MMRKKGLFLCLVSGLLSMLGCVPKKMPEEELVRVELTHSGMRSGYEFEGRAKQDSKGSFMLRTMKESYGPMFEKKLDAREMQEFRQIIQEEMMYKYKEVYTPKIRVLDGWMWSFFAAFTDGSVISSHGSNAGPKDDGLKRIRSYMQKLIQDGVQIENEEE